MHRNSTYVYGLLILLLSSCANYKLNVLPAEKNWADLQPDPSKELEHSMYLIGDAGNSKPGELAKPLQLLKRKLDKAPENSSVIFLGDNIYPDGLAPEGEGKERLLGEHRLKAQLQTLENFKGRPIFIPGNHDWREYGLRGLRRQERLIEEYLNKGIEDEEQWENYFLPDKGCSGPELVKLGPNLVVIVIDSQWWLADWDKEPSINDGCEAKSRKVFSFLFEELVRKHRTKNIVIAMHHPLYTNGTHGGNFTAKQHLFPLTEMKDNLYIPFPVIGSIAAFMRGVTGTRQDIAHPSYKELRRTLMSAAKKNGNFIFASGHEHTLQYFEKSRQSLIVSGAGSKNGPTRLGNGAHFAYGHKGFAQINFYKDGTAWVEYWVTDETSEDGKVVYRHKIRDGLKSLEYDTPTDFPEYDQKLATKSTKILTTPVKKKGGLYKVFFGKHFRSLYLPDYTFPTLDLSTQEGGMKPMKIGGGNQTNSIRLKDAQGRQWSLRSMTKDASRFIPYPFNKLTAAQSIVEDNFLSTHPFAALAVSSLAEAVDVFHTNPRLYYMPKQPALGTYNEAFGEGVYLLEERPSKGWEQQASFGKPYKFVSTPDLTDKLAKNHSHRVDQQWVVKSRLFDMVIGDWDRHDDQWRWGAFKGQDDLKIYRPIPRDRDQPFSKYDGLFTSMARLTLPFLKQLKPYREDPGPAKWANYNARQFDKTFMNGLEWQDWQTEIRVIQQKLTDDHIEKAFEQWPEPAGQQSQRIKEILKVRRDKLFDIARAHYEILAKEVHVAGTNKSDYFKIERLEGGKMRVRVYESNKDKELKRLCYDRTFLVSETRSVALFGMNGDDYFDISGEVKKGILLRLVGGLGDDEVVEKSNVSKGGKKTYVYDDLNDGNKLNLGSEGRDRRSSKRELNIYNRKDYHYEYDFVMPFPVIGFNPDDGLFLGANMTFINYQFKKSPFGQEHHLNGQFAFATGAYNISYLGDFLGALGGWDAMIDAQLQAPQYTINYFGSGNDVDRDTDRNIDFYRVRKSLYRFHPAVKKRFAGGGGRFMAGPVFEYSKVERTAGRFVASDEAGLPNRVFEGIGFAGFEIGLNYQNLNSLRITTRGIRWESGAEWKTDFDGMVNYTKLFANLTIYQSFTPTDRLILATRLGGAHNFGDYVFYQANVLGGRSNMRGYRGERFYGGSSFFHNTDLRLKLLRVKKSGLPFSLGILGGFDYGRVWAEGEESSKWHTAYGGGIWIAPIDYIVIAANLFRSTEDQRFTIGLGFSF